jgi:hypothetical protein
MPAPTATAHVYHALNPTFAEGDKPTFPEEFQHVADVEVISKGDDEIPLDKAYQLTNNITEAWWKNKGVKKLVQGGVRSTSVGDIIVLGGNAFRVCGIGWSFEGVVEEQTQTQTQTQESTNA